MLSSRRGADLDLAVQDEPQLVERVEIEGIADQHLQAAVLFGEGRTAFSRATGFWHEFHHRRRNRDVVQVVVFVAVKLGGATWRSARHWHSRLNDGVLQLEPSRLGDGLRPSWSCSGPIIPFFDEKIPESIQPWRPLLCCRFRERRIGVAGGRESIRKEGASRSRRCRSCVNVPPATF